MAPSHDFRMSRPIVSMRSINSWVNTCKKTGRDQRGGQKRGANLTAHDTFIALHALAGVNGFVVGCALVFGPEAVPKRSLFDLYLWSLVALVVFLAGAIAAHWQHLGGTERLTFSALFVLGLYMLHRARQARLALSTRPEGWRNVYLDHVGFTLISLFDGFVIVSAIDFGAPGWVVGAVAILGVVGGVWAVGKAKSRVWSAQS